MKSNGKITTDPDEILDEQKILLQIFVRAPETGRQ